MDSSDDYRLSFLSWNPEPRRPEDRVPVTIFTGFLGSGKTTLLKHLLEHRQEERFALVINDVGDVNIDAEEFRKQASNENSRVQLIRELTQGCICCSIGNELADAMVYLLENTHPTHVLIEASGVANPKNLLTSFYHKNFAGHSLPEAFEIRNLISVLDSAMFKHEWGLALASRARRRHIFLNDPRTPYLELIMDQIEIADVVVMNKTDLLSPEELKEVDGILAGLNPRAARFACSEGDLEAAALLDEPRFDVQKTQRGGTVLQRLSLTPHSPPGSGSGTSVSHHAHVHHGLDSVTFRARRPVNGERFFNVLRTELPDVIRAKGFYWTEDRPHLCGLLSLAGGILRADWAGPWFIDMLKYEEVTEDDMPATVRAVWQDPPIGDRRNEVVLIGVNLDEENILSALNACLTECPDPASFPDSGR